MRYSFSEIPLLCTSLVRENGVTICLAALRSAVDSDSFAVAVFPKFIELYYNDLGHGPDSQRFAILTAIQERLLHFTHSDLVNVSEEEYRKNCDQQ